MTDEIYVFLGPSLALAEARQILDATYLPPAAVSDVYALVARRPRAIALIDGLFESVPSVWHKEILFALSQGVRVFGSSSMGALRAAELWQFGMEGVGDIFARYRSGEYEADDEVAVEHGAAEFGHRPLSEALVNIRAGLRAASAQGLVTSAIEQHIIETLRRTFYPDRSWALVYQLAARAGMNAAEVEALRDFVVREQPNAKRDDAVQLLRRLADEAARGLAPHVPDFSFEPTTYWRTLLRHVEARQLRSSELSDSAYDRLRDHLRVDAARFPGLLDQALLIELAMAEAQRRGIQISAADIAAVERARGRGPRLAAASSGNHASTSSSSGLGRISVFGRSTRHAQRAVAAKAGAEPPSSTFKTHLEIEALLRKLQRDDAARVTQWLPLALLRKLAAAGGVGPGARLWREFGRTRDRQPQAHSSDADGGMVDRARLLAEFEASAGTAADGWERRARELGFADEEALVAALQRRHLALQRNGVNS